MEIQEIVYFLELVQSDTLPHLVYLAEIRLELSSVIRGKVFQLPHAGHMNSIYTSFIRTKFINFYFL